MHSFTVVSQDSCRRSDINCPSPPCPCQRRKSFDVIYYIHRIFLGAFISKGFNHQTKCGETLIYITIYIREAIQRKNLLLYGFFQFRLDHPPCFLESFEELFSKPDLIRTKVPQSVWTLVIPPNLT